MVEVPGDEKLLAYLYRNKHATPFEMAGLTIEVKAPIFIFREWHRHRTQSYNEMSARYIPMPDENYTPDIRRVMMEGGANKQAQGVKVADAIKAAAWIDRLESLYIIAQETYQAGLDAGVPKELARLAVPVARYSRMMASANLRNWLAFMTLRAHPAAQWEIQQYANAVGEIIAAEFPRTWALFMEGK
jgi:thymidylate synthase (FAD)